MGDLFGDETRVGIFEFSADSYSVNEDGSTTLPVTVNRSQGDNGAVSVVVSLTPGTAVLGADYTTNTVTLDFAAGELRKTLNLPLLIVDDNVLEEPETVNLALALAPGAPAGALLGGRTNATLTINDNDWAGIFEFSQSSYTASEDGLVFDPVMIRRIGGTVGTVNLIVTTLARTNGAVPGVDYINTNITVTFGPGERSKRVRVPVINNFTVGDGTRALDLGLSLGGLSAPDAILGGSDRSGTADQRRRHPSERLAPAKLRQSAGSRQRRGYRRPGWRRHPQPSQIRAQSPVRRACRRQAAEGLFRRRPTRAKALARHPFPPHPHRRGD